MAGEIIVLKPASGSNLTISSGSYEIDIEGVDWGEHQITAALAEGPDVPGAIVGQRQRGTVTSSIPIRITGATGVAYVSACNALVKAANDLALTGGTITRQLDFGSSVLSKELECDVYECSIDAEDGWFQVHRRTALVVLNLTRAPGWLGAYETVGSVTASTSDSPTFTIAVNGNLPGPARLNVENNTATARRYVEVGAALSQYQAADSYKFESSAATAGAATLQAEDTAGDVITASNQQLELATVLPVAQEIGRWSNLTNVGIYQVRLRVKGAATDGTNYYVKALWRAGAGAWQEIATAKVPSTDYYHVDCGTLRNYSDAETIDIRIDGYSDEASTTPPLALDVMYLIPAQLYARYRGLSVASPPAAATIFDDWQNEETAGEAVAGTIAPLPSTAAWTIAGDGDPDWLAIGGGGMRRTMSGTTAHDSTSNIAQGQYLILGSTNTHEYTNVTVNLGARVGHRGAANTESMAGVLARYVSTASWLMGALRVRRAGGGTYRARASLYKRLAGTITQLEDEVIYANVSLLSAQMSLQVGDQSYEMNITAPYISPVTFTGSDVELDTSTGDLATGRVGVYSLVQSTKDNAYTEAYQIDGYSSVQALTETSVVKASGALIADHEKAISASTNSTDPSPVPWQEGNRMWLSPGTGEIVSLIRTSESGSEPDTGFGSSVDVIMEQRPAYATVSSSTS